MKRDGEKQTLRKSDRKRRGGLQPDKIYKCYFKQRIHATLFRLEYAVLPCDKSEMITLEGLKMSSKDVNGSMNGKKTWQNG